MSKSKKSHKKTDIENLESKYLTKFSLNEKLTAKTDCVSFLLSVIRGDNIVLKEDEMIPASVNDRIRAVSVLNDVMMLTELDADILLRISISNTSNYSREWDDFFKNNEEIISK